MFEMEDYSSGYETQGLLNKYSDFEPTLDMYISDSIQDILDIDIRSEIATVVGGCSEFASLVGDFPSTINNNSTNSSSSSTSTYLHTANNTFSSSWLGTSATGSTWSTNDFYADVGACVNPISVMPLINSSLLHKSPKTNLNGLQQSTTSPLPASPNEAKSHLTFSPAQMKLSSGSIRHEQILSHIPKQIVSISSTVTAGTTAPATMATNSLLQRKNVAVTVAAVDAVKKDLGAEMRKVSIPDETKNSISSLLNGSTTTNTIKLGPGIGGLTFANSITYNKLKQQSAAKSPLGSPITANGTIVLKRDRDSSPLHHMTTLNANNGVGNGGGNGQHITKILSRSSFTPKSIASAHSPLMQQQHSISVGSPCSSSSSVSSSHSSPAAIINGAFTAGLAPISNSNHHNHHNTSALSSSTITSIAVKPLQQKIKAAPVESEYPKPAYSYSCLIAMALKNSRSGSLPVSEIYSFMCEHFPYFKTAPSGWKNSVRHNLSLNNSFEKIEKPATNGSQRKGCLWAMNPGRIAKMDEEVQKWSRKDPMAIRNAMVYPEHLDALERGEMKHGTSGDSDVELDSQSEIEETSDLEEHEHELDENIVENMFVEEDIEEEEVEMHHDGSSGGGIHVGAINGDDVRSTGRVQTHHHRDFDIEVEDIYDAIDMEDRGSKRTISESDIIELSPADINVPAHQQNNSVNGGGIGDYQSPKRARVNVNYSIGPARELEKQIHHQQIHQNIRQIKVQQQQHSSVSHHQQQQQQQQQHIVVQTITNTGGNSMTTTTQTSSPIQHFQHFTAIPNHNRRKMQLVNRIA